MSGKSGRRRFGTQFGRHVSTDNLIGSTFGHEPPILEKKTGAAKRLDRRHVVTYKEDSATVASDIADFPEASLLECRISNCQHFVDEQDLRLEMRGYCKSEPHEHATRVAFYRGIQESLDLGKRDYLIELSRDFHPSHAKNGSTQERSEE